LSKIKVAEVFFSIQGEGLWAGVPSVFLRTFGCNFECRGFGMPLNDDGTVTHSTEPEEIAANRKNFPVTEYGHLPLASTGCDSYPSWHKGFKDLSPMLEVNAIAHEINLARSADSKTIKNNGSCHLVITGGEPLLGWQRSYPELLDLVLQDGYKEVTFETNGTQRITDKFANYLLVNQINSKRINYTFSVSPKLPSSGENIEDTLQPDTVVDYQRFGTVYLKFVVATQADLEYVESFVKEYKAAGFTGEVYIMPVGGNPELYHFNTAEVAKLALYYGYRYSPRLQVDIYANAHGT